MTAAHNKNRRKDQGYILLMLLLAMSLLVIAAAIVAPSIAFQVKRDREEEMIHRGVQYSRAIRNYASKTGRFPLKLEDLQETGGVRYIRKLYKDPITGGDFKLLHMSDMPGIGGMSNLNPQPGALAANPVGAVSAGAVPGGSPVGQANGSPGDANQAGQDSQGNPVNNEGTPNAPPPQQAANSGAALGTGGVIFGVASKSKAKTIREFEHKNHYSDWLFFYYPPYGGNRELTGPTPLSMTGGSVQNPLGGPANQPPNQNSQQSPQQQPQSPTQPQAPQQQ